VIQLVPYDVSIITTSEMENHDLFGESKIIFLKVEKFKFCMSAKWVPQHLLLKKYIIINDLQDRFLVIPPSPQPI